MRLDATYRQDYLALDVAAVVARPIDCPLLVIHGSDDANVPLQSGEALFAAAAEPKRFVTIVGGNHLLSSSKHFRRAAREIVAMATDR